MKVAVITDLHFGARNDAPQFLDFYEKFYTQVFFPFLDQHGIDSVCILGDVFDHRKYVNFTTLFRAKRMFFDELIKRRIKVVTLVGNHDVAYKNTNEVNALRLLLAEYENVEVIDIPSYYCWGNREVLMLPWICADNYQQTMNMLKEAKVTTVMGHFEVQGFEMYRGQINHDGFSPNVFHAYELVLSGHFHHRSKQGNIHYLGNPYQLTWADAGDQRGFHLWDTDSNTFEFVVNPFEMFDVITYDDRVMNLETIVEKDYSIWTDKILKVLVASKTNPYWFDVFMTKLEQAGPLSVQVIEEAVDAGLINDRELVESVDDVPTFLARYIDQHCDGVDKDALLKLTYELYTEASVFDWKQG